MSDRVFHTLPPVVDAGSRVLMLGTMPSPKSREAGFYYAHPQNRFWRVMGALFGEETPCGTAQREAFLHRRHIALWDVLASCEIRGADDGSIRSPVANPLEGVLSQADIRAIFTTGTKAAALYRRFCAPRTGRPAMALPSTSPANCRYYTFEKLVEAYRVVLAYI